MSSELSRLKARKKCSKQVDEIYGEAQRAYLIHYSCQSFYDNTSGNSTRITSIAVRNLESGQTKSFSMYKSAELSGQQSNIQGNMDALERSMLQDYFTFLNANHEATYLHWNMRDENYGFAALEHRFRVLGGSPYVLLDNRKFDLARALVTLYGRQYAPHTSPSGRKGRLMSIVEMNHIADADALEGAAEAAAFESGQYLKLHQSTLRKVDIMANIFDRVHGNSLETKGTFADRYGFHWSLIGELLKGSSIVKTIVVFGSIAAALVGFAKAWQLFFP
ncbi:hypothetical protein GmRootV118_17740 [Variovorax sp. V118]|uniref:hypothetical protein n=1 Tax=Variovorax sp. V118 TaxID=3065954 RepID=UPI0034E89ED5